MNAFLKKMANLDKRIIFVLISLAVVIPLLYPLFIEINVNPEVKAVYDTIENLPAGSTVFLAMDFDPASKPELYPMAETVLRHCFSRDLKVIGMTFWVTGVGLGEKAMSDIANEYGKKYGTDYLYLGWKAGGYALVIQMGEKSISAAFPVDHYGRETANMPILQKVTSLKQISYLVELAAGASIGTWYYYGKMRYKFPMGGGCTGVMVASWYNLMKIEWLNGFMGGLRGAAEYEKLIDKKARATRGMDAQSVSHMLIIAMIIFGNIAYFANRAKGNK